MPERAILLVRLRVSGGRTAKYAEAQARFKAVFDGIPGIEGPTLYSAERDGEMQLSVVEIADRAAFELAAAERVNEEMVLAFARVMEGPPSVRLLRIRAHGGKSLAAMEPDTYLSISDRTADPGREDELARDYETVFASFEAIPGFAGWAYGPDGALDERLYGLALWTTRDALGRSLKPDVRHELRIYRKLHASELDTVPAEFLPA